MLHQQVKHMDDDIFIFGQRQRGTTTFRGLTLNMEVEPFALQLRPIQVHDKNTFQLTA